MFVTLIRCDSLTHKGEKLQMYNLSLSENDVLTGKQESLLNIETILISAHPGNATCQERTWTEQFIQQGRHCESVKISNPVQNHQAGLRPDIQTIM